MNSLTKYETVNQNRIVMLFESVFYSWTGI